MNLTIPEQVIDAWNSKDLKRIFGLYTVDFIREDLGTDKIYDIHNLGKVLEIYWKAFPDIHFELHDKTITSDKVVIAWKATGTHRSEFRNIPPTNKQMSFYGVSFLHMREEKISKVEYFWDEAAMLRQMGLLPYLQ